MQLVSLAAVLGLVTPALFQNPSHKVSRGRDTYPLWYDNLYDGAQTSLASVACSNGPNYGLETRGYKVFSDLHTFPAIGGIPMLNGWDSPDCGTCWKLTYTDPNGVPHTLTFTAINNGVQNPDGFTISMESMNALTINDADLETPDGITINVAQVLNSDCGL